MSDFSKDISKFKESFINEGPSSIGTDLEAGNLEVIFAAIHREIVPCEARLINLSGRAGLSGAKPREFKRKIYLYICVYVYIFEGVRTVAWQQ